MLIKAHELKEVYKFDSKCSILLVYPSFINRKLLILKKCLQDCIIQVRLHYNAITKITNWDEMKHKEYPENLKNAGINWIVATIWRIWKWKIMDGKHKMLWLKKTYNGWFILQKKQSFWSVIWWLQYNDLVGQNF